MKFRCLDVIFVFTIGFIIYAIAVHAFSISSGMNMSDTDFQFSGGSVIINPSRIPAAQVNSDWNATSGLAKILNEPSLATVATSGAYSDLSGNPSALPPSGSAGGDLAGTYPNPTLATSGVIAGSCTRCNLTIDAKGRITSQTNGSSGTRTTSSLSLSLVGNGATGTQISSTNDSTIRVNLSASTTSTIGGPATSVIVLKKCSTNSATEGSWSTVSTFENDQTVTLAVALQSIQVMKGILETDVPAGWYVKLENSGTGTHSEAILSGEQTIYQ